MITHRRPVIDLLSVLCDGRALCAYAGRANDFCFLLWTTAITYLFLNTVNCLQTFCCVNTLLRVHLHSISLSLCRYKSVSVSASLSLCRSVSLSICLSVPLPLSISLSLCLSVSHAFISHLSSLISPTLGRIPRTLFLSLPLAPSLSTQFSSNPHPVPIFKSSSVPGNSLLPNGHLAAHPRH